MKKKDVERLVRAARTFLSYGRKCPPGCPCGYDAAEKELREALENVKITISWPKIDND